jgi:HK97 family phage prohead protease
VVLWGYGRCWMMPDTDGPRTRGSTSARERFAPFAFAKWLSRGREVKALWEHSYSREIASTTDSSLAIWEDRMGLAFTMKPRGEFADQVIGEVRAGRLRYVSVGGIWFDDYVYEHDGRTGELFRTVLESSVREISLVARPAALHTVVRATERFPLFMLSRRLDALNSETSSGRSLIG